ncbi:MAG: zinc ribbon domain-containing protein [Bacteroidales bacterium]|nr:zinc ribbon domain-containing protein [Bacteroidales bacterium]
MKTSKYTCPKCGNRFYDVDEFRATGSFLTKLFNIQNKRFTTISCTRCFYTEIYKASSNQLGNILDFFTN